MPRRDPIAEILDKLDGYLCDGASLPATRDGKVNVAALVAALGLRAADAQYFFREDSAIKETVNAVASTQGLHPVGHRGSQARADAVVQSRLARTEELARKDAQGAVEARHAYAALAREHAEALQKNAELRQDLAAVRRRLAAYEQLIPFDRLAAEVPLP